MAWTDPTGRVSLVAVRPASSWYGVPFPDVEDATGTRVAFVARMASISVAEDYMVVQEEDELYLAVEGRDPEGIRDILVEPPGGEDS